MFELILIPALSTCTHGKRADKLSPSRIKNSTQQACAIYTVFQKSDSKLNTEWLPHSESNQQHYSHHLHKIPTGEHAFNLLNAMSKPLHFLKISTFKYDRNIWPEVFECVKAVD